MAILEALACSTPVVISENCHFPELTETGAGQVVTLETEELAAALERVLVDSTLRREMGQAGRQLVEKHYTWPPIAEQTVELYRRLGAGR